MAQYAIARTWKLLSDLQKQRELTPREAAALAACESVVERYELAEVQKAQHSAVR